MVRSTRINYDRLGIITSVLCAIHCTVLPLLATVLPFLGVEALEHPGIEWSFIALALLFGTLSMRHGYKHHHRRKLPFSLFLSGFVLLVLNQVFAESFVFLFIPASAVCIITAHALNLVYCRRSSASCEA